MDTMNKNCIGAFQLKECYDLAAYYEKLDRAKTILRERGQKIDIHNDHVSMQTDIIHQESEMQIVSEAIYELSLEGLGVSVNKGLNYEEKVHNLADSGEKEFVLALIALRNGVNETQRIEAAKHISNALSFSHNDPRYLALANVLREVDK